MMPHRVDELLGIVCPTVDPSAVGLAARLRTEIEIFDKPGFKGESVRIIVMYTRLISRV